MRVVDHMLVVHGIWVADYKCRQLFELLLSFQIVSVESLSRRREEHCINLSFLWVFRADPDMIPIESACKDLAHLFVFTKEWFEATVTPCAEAETPTWFQRTLRELDELLYDQVVFFEQVHVLICFDNLRHESVRYYPVHSVASCMLRSCISL